MTPVLRAGSTRRLTTSRLPWVAQTGREGAGFEASCGTRGHSPASDSSPVTKFKLSDRMRAVALEGNGSEHGFGSVAFGMESRSGRPRAQSHSSQRDVASPTMCASSTASASSMRGGDACTAGVKDEEATASAVAVGACWLAGRGTGHGHGGVRTRPGRAHRYSCPRSARWTGGGAWWAVGWRGPGTGRDSTVR